VSKETYISLLQRTSSQTWVIFIHFSLSRAPTLSRARPLFLAAVSPWRGVVLTDLQPSIWLSINFSLSLARAHPLSHIPLSQRTGSSHFHSFLSTSWYGVVPIKLSLSLVRARALSLSSLSLSLSHARALSLVLFSAVCSIMQKQTNTRRRRMLAGVLPPHHQRRVLAVGLFWCCSRSLLIL